MGSKKKTWRDHPELALVPLMTVVAREKAGQADAVLDNEARSFEPKPQNWPDMFNRFPKFAPDTAQRAKSANHPAMSSATGLFHSATSGAALDSWLRAAEVERTEGFELAEPGSRLEYGCWNLQARLLAYRWAKKNPQAERAGALAEYATAWLSLYWTLRALSIVVLPDGPMSLRCGARSQGVFDRTKQDIADSIAFGLPWRPRTKPHPLPDKAWLKSDEVLALEALRPEIEESAKPVRQRVPLQPDGGERWKEASGLAALVPKWPTLCPTWYLRTAEGVAVWCEKADLNSNTPGISAMIWNAGDPGKIFTMPSPSRDHIRQKKVPQVIQLLAGNRLHFKQSPPGKPEEFEGALPGGEVFYRLRHGEGGLEVK